MTASEAAVILMDRIRRLAQILPGEQGLRDPELTLGVLGQLRRLVDQYVSLFDQAEDPEREVVAEAEA